MLLLRRWDETLAGKTQGKTVLMHEVSVQPEPFSRVVPVENSRNNSSYLACVFVSLQCASFLKLSDGWSKTTRGFSVLYLMPALLEGQDNGSRWSLQTNGLILGF